jgi:hypothetical protein
MPHHIYLCVCGFSKENLSFATLGIHISNTNGFEVISFKPEASYGHTFCIDATLFNDVQRYCPSKSMYRFDILLTVYHVSQ